MELYAQRDIVLVFEISHIRITKEKDRATEIFFLLHVTHHGLPLACPVCIPGIEQLDDMMRQIQKSHGITIMNESTVKNAVKGVVLDLLQKKKDK